MLSTHMGCTKIYSGLQKNYTSQGLIHCCWDTKTKKKTEDKWKEKKISSPVDHTVDTSCISTLHTLPAVRLSIRSFAYLSLVQIKMQLLPFELFLYIVQMQQDDNAQGYSTHIVCIEKPNSVDC